MPLRNKIVLWSWPAAAAAGSLALGLVVNHPAPAGLAFALGGFFLGLLFVSRPHVEAAEAGDTQALNRTNQHLKRLLTKYQDTQVQLEEATRQAVAASEAKGSFLASMSHEIRTPINGLMGFAKLLQDTQLSRTQKEYVDIINGSGHALLAVINDILDFSKLEAGKLTVSIEPFDFREIVATVTDLLGARATENNVTLAVSCPDDLNTLALGDSGRVRQVLLNLVGNAVKFTEKGHVYVEVRTDEEKGIIRCAVKDTGVGIRSEAVGHLFQQFSQADESTTRKFGGTGLGLAISKSLIDMMHGEIGVESEFGVGSVFWFTIPLTADAPCNVESLPPTVPADACLLVLEPEEINRRVLAEQLDLWQVEHHFVETTEAAQARLQQRRWSAILIPQEIAARKDPFTTALVAQAKDGLKILTSNRPGHALDAHVIEGVTIHFILAAPLGRRDRLWELVESLNRNVPVTGDTRMIENWMEEPEVPHSIAMKKPQVLVAEDNAVNLKLATKFLELLGCEVDHAVNGLEAIDRFTANSYEVIFMDCHMPQCDGYEATRRIRLLEQELHREPTPIVALTANVVSEGREECEAAGMDDFVSKPVELEALEDCLKRCQQVVEEQDSLAA